MKIMSAKGSPIASMCSSSKDRKSTRLNSSHQAISYAVFCLKKESEMARRRCNARYVQQNRFALLDRDVGQQACGADAGRRSGCKGCERDRVVFLKVRGPTEIAPFSLHHLFPS